MEKFVETKRQNPIFYSVRIITIQKIYVFGQRLARTVENQVNVPDSGTGGG